MNGRMWTDAELDVVREKYPLPETTAREIGELIGRSAGQVHQAAARLGIKKPEIFRSLAGKKGTQSEAAKAHRFTKGHVPQNKGKKMSPEVYAKAAPTMFKKGSTPVNHREVGSERVNVDGYVEIKVAEPNKWRLKHRVLWEQVNGEIPAGMNVQFKNGNSQDVRIENLYLISKSDQLKNENSLMARYPKEVADVIRLRGSLKRQITMYNKKNSKCNE